MTTTIKQAAFLEHFSCLGDKCEDTCCKGWGMQLTQETVDKYKAEAPELLDAVTSGEAEHIMKRDPETDYCIKYDKGWCGIHSAKGTDFLGDACHFFPRVTRKLGDHTLMTASLSCPEVVRLALMENHGFALKEDPIERLPYSLKDYQPEELEGDKALEVHRAFIEAAKDESAKAERILARIRSVAASMQAVDIASWGMAVSFYFNNVEGRLPNAEAELADPFNLLNAFQGLIGASKQTNRPRLDQTVTDMEKALDVTLDWEKLSISTTDKSLEQYKAMESFWRKECEATMQPVLKRWIQAQLAMALFPYAGFGETLTDRVTILGVRFATIKLALQAASYNQQACVDKDEAVRIIQSIARFLDHLADPQLSIHIYTETGWVRESRLRALIGDY